MEATEQKTTSPVKQVLEVAKQQKRLLWLILLQIIFGIVIVLIEPRSIESRWWFVLFLSLGIICAYLVYKIGRSLEISTLWLIITIVLLFAPYIGIVPLLYMNIKATRFLWAAGVRVGLMGAKRKSIGQIFELE
jgi:cell division protein FtsW (lipid II flippase)